VVWKLNGPDETLSLWPLGCAASTERLKEAFVGLRRSGSSEADGFRGDANDSTKGDKVSRPSSWDGMTEALGGSSGGGVGVRGGTGSGMLDAIAPAQEARN
jgi:hypothetical protein